MTKRKVIICFIAILLLFLVFGLFLTSRFAVTLNGNKEIDIEVGSTYKEKGAKALFGLRKIKPEGLVNTKRVGKYKIKYQYFYSTITRTINVVDLDKPLIKLRGNVEVNLVLNGIYNELGFEANDNYDGNLTDKVKVTNNIDNKKAGLYEIIYEVKDSSGNKNKVIRKVFVNEKGPLTMNLSEYSLDGYFDSTILKESTPVGNDYINETVFYGDSITYNFAYYQALPWNVIWAKSSVTPENAHTWAVPINPHGVEMTLVDAVSKYKPKRLIVTLGANAVAIMTEKYFISTYEELVEKVKKVSPNTLLIVQSIYPVDSKWDTSANTNNTINNTKINRLNYLLAEMCERQNIKFLNSAVVLKDEYGQCKKGYCYYSDGIHLMPDGNNKIMEYIKTHAYIGGE